MIQIPGVYSIPRRLMKNRKPGLCCQPHKYRRPIMSVDAQWVLKGLMTQSLLWRLGDPEPAPTSQTGPCVNMDNIDKSLTNLKVSELVRVVLPTVSLCHASQYASRIGLGHAKRAFFVLAATHPCARLALIVFREKGWLKPYFSCRVLRLFGICKH